MLHHLFSPVNLHALIFQTELKSCLCCGATLVNHAEQGRCCNLSKLKLMGKGLGYVDMHLMLRLFCLKSIWTSTRNSKMFLKLGSDYQQTTGDNPPRTLYEMVTPQLWRRCELSAHSWISPQTYRKKDKVFSCFVCTSRS
jgi:hypothetical protein